jgi:hypothetical protein
MGAIDAVFHRHRERLKRTARWHQGSSPKGVSKGAD